jgi:hypothetical protein
MVSTRYKSTLMPSKATGCNFTYAGQKAALKLDEPSLRPLHTLSSSHFI